MANVKFLLKRSIGTAKGVLKAGTEIDLDEAVAKSWEAADFGKIVSKKAASPTDEKETAANELSEMDQVTTEKDDMSSNSSVEEEVAAEKEDANIEPPAAEEVKVDGPKETKKGRKGRKNKPEKENEEK
jgi:hypothetical protein